MGLRAWLYRRSEAGNRRVLFLLALIARAWRFLIPAPIRRPLERLGRLLQLDERLTPALTAPVICAVAAHAGTWWLLVAGSVLAIWGHAVAGRQLSMRRQFVGVVLALPLLFVTPLLIVVTAPTVWEGIGEASGWAFRLGFYGLLLAGLAFTLVAALGWALPLQPRRRDTQAALLGATFGTLVGLMAYLGLIPGGSLVEYPTRVLGLSTWSGLAVDVLAVAFVVAATFVAARRWHPPRPLRRVLIQLVTVASVTAWVLPIVFAYAALSAIPERLEAERYDGRGFARGLIPSHRPDELPPAELARTYAPLLLLHRDERWLASDAIDYQRAASVWSLTAAGRLKEPLSSVADKLPAGCRASNPAAENAGPVSICYALVGDCLRARRSPWSKTGGRFAVIPG